MLREMKLCFKNFTLLTQIFKGNSFLEKLLFAVSLKQVSWFVQNLKCKYYSGYYKHLMIIISNNGARIKDENQATFFHNDTCKIFDVNRYENYVACI